MASRAVVSKASEASLNPRAAGKPADVWGTDVGDVELDPKKLAEALQKQVW
jgi:hypothetical protein